MSDLNAMKTLIRRAIKFSDWAAGEGISPAGYGEKDHEERNPDEFLLAYSVATGDEDWNGLSDRIFNRISELKEELKIDGGKFDEWSLSDFAAQCKMQSRDQLDPEFSRFMATLSAALETHANLQRAYDATAEELRKWQQKCLDMAKRIDALEDRNYGKAAKDAATLGTGYVRLNEDGSTSLLDPSAVLLASAPMTETLETYFERQIGWSRETFGPALRTGGVIDHIRKELREIEANPHDLSEWVDVVILAMDGFWRHGGEASDLLPALLAKQRKNMSRTWPDWRTMSEDSAIEHDRSHDAP